LSQVKQLIIPNSSAHDNLTNLLNALSHAFFALDLSLI